MRQQTEPVDQADVSKSMQVVSKYQRQVSLLDRVESYLKYCNQVSIMIEKCLHMTMLTQ